MAALILPIEAILPHASAPFGAKARTLTALVRAGFPVPAAHVVSAQAAWRHFERVLPAALQPRQLLSSRSPERSQLDEARELVLLGALEPELADGLSAALSGLGGGPLAVRASSTAADPIAATVLGSHSATLGVVSEAELQDAVRAAWTEIFELPTLPRVGRVLGDGAAPPGVVLQAMVPASVSGVLFTSHPLTSAADEMLLNAYAGPDGDSDSGRRTPDTYRIHKPSGWVRDRVLGDVHARRMLDERMLGRLIELGRRIEEHAEGPRRVHWAIDGDSIYVIDSREFLPRGVEPRPGRKRRGSGSTEVDPVDVVWSRAFVGEVLPSVVSPLTWSLLRDFIGHGLRASLQDMGCRVPARADLLGNFRGRAYVSLTELLRLAPQVPGLHAMVEQRVVDPDDRQRLLSSLPRPGRTFGALRLARLATRFVSQQLALAARVEGFVASFDDEVARVRGVDLRVLPAAALDATLSDVHRLFDTTAGLAITAHMGLLACMPPLSSVLDSTSSGAATGLWQVLLDDDALSGALALPSELARLADVVDADADARAAVLAGGGMPTAEGAPARAFARLLADLGHVAPGGVELRQARLHEQPELLLCGLRLQLEAMADGGGSPWVLCQRRAAVHRARAQEQVDGFGLATRLAVEQMLGVARHFVRLRQQLLQRVDVALAVLRELALDASRRLRIREPACGGEAAFLLTLPELHASLRGELGPVAPLLALRRSQGDREVALPAAPESFAGYPRPQPEASATEWVGRPAAAGSVVAEVHVVRGAQDLAGLRPGLILVLPNADLGSSPLYATAAGLILERGGVLSPACMLARQLGLPVAVQVPGAMTHLRSGQRVRLDGDTGSVQLQ